MREFWRVSISRPRNITSSGEFLRVNILALKLMKRGEHWTANSFLTRFYALCGLPERKTKNCLTGLCSLLPKVFWKMTSRIACNLLEKFLVSSNIFCFTAAIPLSLAYLIQYLCGIKFLTPYNKDVLCCKTFIWIML